jgi:hypothetical protein
MSREKEVRQDERWEDVTEAVRLLTKAKQSQRPMPSLKPRQHLLHICEVILHLSRCRETYRLQSSILLHSGSSNAKHPQTWQTPQSSHSSNSPENCGTKSTAPSWWKTNSSYRSILEASSQHSIYCKSQDCCDNELIDTAILSTIKQIYTESF